MIDRATIDKIMDATNIVDVVGEFVNLRKAGVNYKGLCPFHDDKTPSFMVSPSKQICHCFACGEGGNAVNFLMKHEQITYPEALRWLAKKYNIEIEERELSMMSMVRPSASSISEVVVFVTTSSRNSSWVLLSASAKHWLTRPDAKDIRMSSC